MKTAPEFHTLFQLWRQEAGKTLREVAVVMNLSVAYVSDLEWARRKPPADMDKLERFAQLVGKEACLDELLEAANCARLAPVSLRPKSHKQQELAVALARRIGVMSSDDVDRILEQLKKEAAK